MKKAALYARVSSLDQREGRTIESQIDELKKHIVGNEHVLVKEYIDDGYTGTRLDRPALEQMRADLKTKLFDAIYFLHADRMARDSTHQDIVINDIIQNKKELYINNEDYEHNPENYFKLKILGAVAELERAKIVERTTRGRLHRLRLGQVTSQGSNRIFGYRYVKKTQTTPPALEIYEPEAKIVRTIFEMMASGTYSIHRITRWLEDQEVPTRMGKKVWESYNISKMLENRTYAGTRYCNRMAKVKAVEGKKLKYGTNILRDRKEWILIKVPAIVSEELFEKAQEQLRKRRDRYIQPQQHQLLSGLVRCGECGYSVSSYRRRVGMWLKIGVRRIYHKVAYKCVWRQKSHAHSKAITKKCSSPEVITSILEKKVFAMIKETMLDTTKLKSCMDYFRKDYRSSQKRVEWKLMRLENKEKEIDKQKRKLIDAYVAGQLTQQEYVNRNVALDKELLGVKNKREELLSAVPLLDKKDVVEVSIREFCNSANVRLEKCNDFDSKRQFLVDHIEKVIYQKDKVVIIGSVPLRSSDRMNRSELTENLKIEFKIESDFNKKDFHKKNRAQYLVDSRLREWGSGGRHAESHKARVKELQLPAIKASQLTQKIVKRDLRDGYMSYTAKSYIEKQKIWNEAREKLVSNIFQDSKHG